LKIFLFFPVLLFSNEIFTLPQEADSFINTYTKALLKTQKEVYIFSDTIDEYSVVQALRKLTKKDIKIYIISDNLHQEKNKAAYLNLLNGVHLYTLIKTEHKPLQGSYTCIDDKILYLSTQSFQHTSLITNHSFALSQNIPCKTVFMDLLKLCTKIK